MMEGKNSNNKIYFKNTEDDTWKELANGFTNLTVSSVEFSESIDNFVSSVPDSPISLDLEYENKRIKKKRLIKLLMSENFSRNKAYEIAKNVWKQKKCYDIIDITLAEIGVYWL